MIITAFLGHILPWGQMSFRAAMVITSLLAAIPLIGADLIFSLRGGYSIQDVTLHRFHSLHFFFPFIILAVAIVHILFLHEFGSSSPIGLSSVLDGIPFTPYYVLKDGWSVISVTFILFIIINISPDLFGHSVNYEKANFLITPPHIVPEWYLLFLYAILRSVTNKLFGFFLMVCSIVALFFLRLLPKGFIIRSSVFKPWHAVWFWFFSVTCLLSSRIGSLPVIDPYLGVGQFLTVFYSMILLIFSPLGGPIEHLIYDAYIYLAIEEEEEVGLYCIDKVNTLSGLTFSKLIKKYSENFLKFYNKVCLYI